YTTTDLRRRSPEGTPTDQTNHRSFLVASHRPQGEAQQPRSPRRDGRERSLTERRPALAHSAGRRWQVLSRPTSGFESHCYLLLAICFRFYASGAFVSSSQIPRYMRVTSR